MEKNFIPNMVEDNLYKKWEENKYFKCRIDKSKKPFVVVMPPPNVTGKLHMGHALDQTIQDIFIRYNRMNNTPTLWVPGTDHSSIATEVKVVERLRSKGIYKHDLGREKFLEEAWKWTDEFGGEIKKQIRKLGSSCDWDKERFTLDETCTKAVVKSFEILYNKGYIYRGNRIVNWCPKCKTSISETEVDYSENKGKLWYIKYKIEDSNEYIEVATTRPETILGDTALAVNPNDERYKKYIGKKVILPLINRLIPIVSDDYVEKDFGTGVVKITPAHDPNDYLVGQRHNLESINIMNEDATMNNNAGKYEGQDRYEARNNIIEDLNNLGAISKIEDYINKVGSCYRCNTVIEPYLSLQWFVKMDELVKPALESVRNGDIEFVPKRFEKTYFNWMENIENWCISRQLWWGHRIPAYYCDSCEKIIVSKESITKCECGGNLKQDEDCLDTWFSSALWPFSVFGWPEITEDLKYFYPTNVLVTGYDIITFWVSKMIFSGLEYMKDIPFKYVYIHGLVRDSIGRKMSKSLGNGVDPLEIIEKYGADSLRFALIHNTSPGNDVRYMLEKIESASNFVNKIWNATKFVKLYLTDVENVDKYELKIEDKWIINKLNELITNVRENIDKFEIGIALNLIYEFIQSIYCDWYIELVKPRLYNKDESYEAAVSVLNYVLKSSVQLLHPYMPFITEEIYLNLNHEYESVMISDYPEIKYEIDSKEILVIEQIIEFIRQIRNYRAEVNIPNSKKVDCKIYTENKTILKECEGIIKKLGNIENVEYIDNEENLLNFYIFHLDSFNIYIDFSLVINKEEEYEKLKQERTKILKELERANSMLNNEKFVSKAPEELINTEREKVLKYNEILRKIDEKLK
jgi:valyl-tRNA synthetase